MSDVTADQIVAAIRSLGARPGDLLLVHSSLSSFGRVAGGAEAVAHALVESVSPGGTVFVPTFNYGQRPYDPLTTPSLTGAISEAFRRLPGALRSVQPTHPVAGIGPAAEEILAEHENTTPFGPGSPLWRLWQRNAWVLLIGCDHRTSSIIHVAEEAMQLAYLHRTRQAKVLRDGQWIEITVRKPGDSSGYQKLDVPLRAAGKIREIQVGQSRFMLMRAADVVEAAIQLLRRDPAALLCDDPTCERCHEARAMLTAAKTTDVTTAAQLPASCEENRLSKDGR